MPQPAAVAEVLIKAVQVVPQKKLRNRQEVAEALTRKVQVAPRKKLKNQQEAAEAQQNKRVQVALKCF